MSYTFPDVERALLEILGERATLWIEYGFENDLPVTHLYAVGGREAGPLRTDRVSVDVYATSRDEAKTGAEQVRSTLTSGPHHTTEGLIDSVDTEVLPHMLPYMSESVTRYTATYRVHVRPV